MALKLFYSPIQQWEEVGGGMGRCCYMTGTHKIMGPYIDCRINNKGYLVVVDEAYVPNSVELDTKIREIGDWESWSRPVPTAIKNKLVSWGVPENKVNACGSLRELFRKLLRHKACNIDVAMIKAKLAAGKSCFMGFKFSEMDF